jgi:hypothetical protein
MRQVFFLLGRSLYSCKWCVYAFWVLMFIDYFSYVLFLWFLYSFVASYVLFTAKVDGV